MKEVNYLREVFSLLLERARSAKDEVDDRSSSDPAAEAFSRGRVQGYYEALSVILGQLDAFGIDRSDVGVPNELNLERDLI